MSLNEFFDSLSGKKEDDPAQAKAGGNQKKPNADGDAAKDARIQNLQGQLDEIEDYKPVIQAMRSDPNLVNHIGNYFAKDGEGKEMKDKLQIPEDFEFSFTDAATNEGSDSYKLLTSLIDTRAKAHSDAATRNITQKNEMDKQKVQLMQEFSVTEDEWKDFMKFSARGNWTLKDLFFLFKKEKGELNLDNKKIKEKSKAMANAKTLAFSHANEGIDNPNEGKTDDEIFEEQFIGAIKDVVNPSGGLF